MNISIFSPAIREYIINKSNITELGKSDKTGCFECFDKVKELYCNMVEIFPDEPSMKQIYKYQCSLFKFISIKSPFLVGYKGFSTSYPFKLYMEKMSFSFPYLLEKCSGKINPTSSLITLIGITKGLDYLHKKKIIVGNLNLNMIYYDENDHPKIGRFGIYTSYDEMVRRCYPDLTGFKAPEIIRDDALFDKSDIFSLGMIMYCISEKTTKPLQKFKEPIEYLKYICEKNERPKFKKTTPELQKIISDCWKSQVNERPTAKDVLDKIMIYIDKIFPEANMEDVQEYIQYTENLAKNESQEQKKPIPFSFGKSLLRRKTSKNLNDVRNDFIEPIKLTYEESIIPIILSNYQHEYFLSCLNYCEKSLLPEKSIEIIPIFISHFQADIPYQYKDLILSSLIRMIQRDPKFVRIFGEQSLISYLPYQRIFIGKTIYILQYLFYYAPSSILISYFKFFNYLFQNNPNEIMPLVHYFAYHSLSIQNPWGFFDILINSAKQLRDFYQGTALLQALLYICDNNNVIYNSRKKNLDEIFYYYINSSVEESVKLAYIYICKEDVDIPQINETTLLKHLKKKELICYVVSVLLRADIMTKEIIAVLFSILEQKVEFLEDIWLLFYHISENQNAEDLFLSSSKWLSSCVDNPENGIKLILLLSKFKKIRELILSKDIYIQLLSKININQNENRSLILTLLLHTELNQNTVSKLSEMQFLNIIISYGNENQDLWFKINTMKLIQKLYINFGYISDFSIFVPSFIELLTIQECYKQTVHIISLLSSSSEFTIKICKEDKNVINYFKGIVKYAQLSNDASSFLRNVQNSLSSI